MRLDKLQLLIKPQTSIAVSGRLAFAALCFLPMTNGSSCDSVFDCRTLAVGHPASLVEQQTNACIRRYVFSLSVNRSSSRSVLSHHGAHLGLKPTNSLVQMTICVHICICFSLLLISPYLISIAISISVCPFAWDILEASIFTPRLDLQSSM